MNTLPEGKGISDAESYFGPLAWTGSLMFSRSNLDSLYGAMNGVMPSTAVNAPVTGVAAPQNDGNPNNKNLPVTTFAPAYYLQSIMFFADDNWSLWMNGKKNSFGHARKDNLIVSRLRNDKVEFIWFDPNLNDMLPGWRDKFKPLASNKGKLAISTDTYKGAYHWDYVSQDGTMLADSSKGAVRFTLQPNQSFKSYELSVVEGQAEGKSITFTPGQNNGKTVGSGSMSTPVSEGVAPAPVMDSPPAESSPNGKKDPNALMKRVFNNAP